MRIIYKYISASLYSMNLQTQVSKNKRKLTNVIVNTPARGHSICILQQLVHV